MSKFASYTPAAQAAPVWNRVESENGTFIDALVIVAQTEGCATFRGLTPAGSYFVKVYCPARTFRLYQSSARIEVRAAAMDALQRATIAAAKATAQAELAAKAAAKPERKAVKAPCKHAGTIRHLYAIAGERGLDVKDNGAMRRAFSEFFGFVVFSRSELSASHWAVAAQAVSEGRLAW